VPFLKWAGGKRWLMPLGQAIRSCPIGTYFEPFIGSAAMYFSVRPSRAVLSDANHELVGTYAALKDHWSDVQDALDAHDDRHCAEYYYETRASRPRAAHLRAARFIYLNRTCWNGLYRVNKKGQFNTPIGSKPSAVLDSDDFKAVSSLLQGAVITPGDFEVPLGSAGKGDLIFADPPYTVRHQYNGFVKYNEQLFSWADQERLCATLVSAKKRGARVICTNADHSSIRELYGPHFDLVSISRFSSIAGKGGARGSYAEVVILG
jgi:DNA adenine methylase